LLAGVRGVTIETERAAVARGNMVKLLVETGHNILMTTNTQVGIILFTIVTMAGLTFSLLERLMLDGAQQCLIFCLMGLVAFQTINFA
jgi:hypothetical protein